MHGSSLVAVLGFVAVVLLKASAIEVALVVVIGTVGCLAGAIWGRLFYKMETEEPSFVDLPAQSSAETDLLGDLQRECVAIGTRSGEEVELTAQAARLVIDSQLLLVSSRDLLNRSRNLSLTTRAAISQSRLRLSQIDGTRVA